MSGASVGSIVVGSDLSTASDRVIRAAAAISRRARLPLHVVSAYDLPRSRFADAEAGLSEGARAEAEAPLPAQLRRVLPAEDQPASQQVRFAPAAAAILERATEVDASLIVLGPHRGGDVHAHFLGTTTDEVVRRTTVPCLVLRGSLNLPVRNVGVATDFSEVAECALEEGLRWAVLLGDDPEQPDPRRTRLSLVHATARAEGEPISPGPLLAEILSRIDPYPAERLELRSEVLADGDPAVSLVRWAERASLDLLVSGTRGKSAPARLVLGSVSSALARRSPAPILLVPSPDSQQGD